MQNIQILVLERTCYLGHVHFLLYAHYHAGLSGLSEPKPACPINSNSCSSYFVIKTRLVEDKG